MSESPTYIGPFGRILPVPKNIETHKTKPVSGSEATPSAMAAPRLRQLPLPTRLQFGTDPTMGLTEPVRYGSTNSNRRLLESHRSTSQDILPSLIQTLTPRSLSSPGTSPFPQQFDTNASMDTRSSQPSPRRGVDSDQYDFARPYYYSGGNSTIISPQPQYLSPSGDSSSMNTNVPDLGSSQFSPPYGDRSDYEMLSYASNNNVSRQSIPSIQTISSPASYYHGRPPSVSHESPTSPALPSGQSGQDMPSGSKPPHRLVGEEVVPGEGLCYMYSDGTHVRKMIDGETVNAQWGVTKAGKARKRLAEACVACRDKKIRCEPGEPKCVQCEKSGRDCRFQTARTKSQFDNQYFPFFSGPRSRQSSITSGSVSLDSPYVKKRQVSIPQPGKAASVMKRARQGSPDVTEIKSEIQESKSTQGELAAPDILTQRHPDRFSNTTPWSNCPEHLRHFQWSNDPHKVDSVLVLHYIDLYFAHINPATYSMFPKEAFMRWLQNSMKSADEKMVLYSMLAMSSVFSTREEREVEGTHFAKWAQYAIEKSCGMFTIQLVQSRMLLGLYYFALGRASSAFDLAGASFRAVAALKLNVEEGISKLDGILEFGLNQHGLIECRRRTFWAAFMMDRYNGYCTSHLNMLRKEDTFVRYPCLDEKFANQEETMAPFFDNGLVQSSLSLLLGRSSLGIMAYLVQVSTIWGDVSEHIYWSSQRLRENHADRHEAFHADVYHRLEKWHFNLPDYLSFSINNLDQSIERGYTGAYISLYALYHTSCMMINRHVRQADLSLESVNRNLSLSIHHAQKFLHIVDLLSSKTTDIRASTSQNRYRQEAKPSYTFSTPFPGYAILTAIDIISAAGSLENPHFTDSLRIMNNSLKIVQQLSLFWASARDQCKAIMRRIDCLSNSIIGRGSRYKAWVMSGPMGSIAGADHDILYTGRRIVGNRENSEIGGGTVVLRALGIEVEERDILVVDDADSRSLSADRAAISEDEDDTY